MYLAHVDVGDCSIECPYCEAQLWYEERSDKCKRLQQVDFSLCFQKGKVQLPLLKKPPQLLQKLLKGEDTTSQHFLQYIRSYNNMFSFTSIGAKIHSSINDGCGPPQFILSGQNYHRIGSLLPDKGSSPKFAQLYIYDTKNETTNRVSHFGYAYILYYFFYESLCILFIL